MTEINQDRLDGIVRLDAGEHLSPEAGMCLMEAVAYVGNLPFSDDPPCTCPVLAAYCRTLNDRMPGSMRHRLIAYIPKLVNTVADDDTLQARRYLLVDRAIRVIAATALEAVGLEKNAKRLHALETVVDDATARAGARAAMLGANAAAANAAIAHQEGVHSAVFAYDKTISACGTALFAAAGASATAAAAASADVVAAAAAAARYAAYVKRGETVSWEAIWDTALETLDMALEITGKVVE